MKPQLRNPGLDSLGKRRRAASPASPAHRRPVLRSSDSEGESRKPAMLLAGSGGSDTGGGVSSLPAKSLVPYIRGFRFTAPPATFGPSLPGLRRCAQFAFFPSLVALPREPPVFPGFRNFFRFPPRGPARPCRMTHDQKFSFASSLGRKTPSLRMSLPSKRISPPPQSLRWMLTMSQCTCERLPLSAIS